LSHHGIKRLNSFWYKNVTSKTVYFINTKANFVGMGLISTLFDFIFHVDKYLGILIQTFGVFTYFILFAIVFCETGLVLTPFLPGDSLLFVAGAFAGNGALNIVALFFIFFAAAVLGDNMNYWIGNYFGEKVFAKSRFFKQEYLDKTKAFYTKHGVKTIIIARFVPIIRTFSPFVAGVGKMKYSTFFIFDFIGGFVWVSLFLFAGYFFGTLPWVEKNLTLVIFTIIFVSLIPPVIEIYKHWRASKKNKASETPVKQEEKK